MASPAPENEDIEETLDEKLSDVWDKAHPPEERVADPLEEAVVEEAELPEPHQHWSKQDRDIFATMNAPQRERWIERERTFEQGFQQRAGELHDSRQAISEFHGMLAPLVEEWTWQGLAPSQGLLRLVALEKDLRTDPAQALLRLAREHSVDLEKTWGDQPYVDPQTRAVQDQQTALQQRIENFERQQAQQRHDQAQQQNDAAARAVQNFAEQTDADGALLYPYVADRTIMSAMGKAISDGRAMDLPTAYSAAMDEMRAHPFYRDTMATQSGSKSKTIARAKTASKVVRGEALVSKSSDRDAISAMLDAAGFE